MEKNFKMDFGSFTCLCLKQKERKKKHFGDWIKILIFAYWARVGQKGTDRVPKHSTFIFISNMFNGHSQNGE